MTGSKSMKMATTQVQYPIILRLHILLKFKNTVLRLIDEQLPQWPLSSRPTRSEHDMGSSLSTYAQSSKRVVLSHTTSDKDKSERAVVEPTLLRTNCYCQRFSPETLPHFLKGEDESGLKRRLKS